MYSSGNPIEFRNDALRSKMPAMASNAMGRGPVQTISPFQSQNCIKKGCLALFLWTGQFSGRILYYIELKAPPTPIPN